MVAVNSANECPYCEGLHGELARMAGVDPLTPNVRSLLAQIEGCPQEPLPVSEWHMDSFVGRHVLLAPQPSVTRHALHVAAESAVLDYYGSAVTAVVALTQPNNWGSLRRRFPYSLLVKPGDLDWPETAYCALLILHRPPASVPPFRRA